MITCKKENCKQAYIGQTERPLKKRLGEHKQYIRDENTNQATGEHFCSPGHSLDDLKITVLEKVKFYNEAYRTEREHYFIRIFNTFYQGINKQK